MNVPYIETKGYCYWMRSSNLKSQHFPYGESIGSISDVSVTSISVRIIKL